MLPINLQQAGIFNQKTLTQNEFNTFATEFFDKAKNNLIDNPPAFFSVLDDQKNQTEILNYVQKEKENFDNFIICGIGGSALGTRAVRDAINHKKTKLTILDTIDPDYLTSFIKKDFSRTLFLIISKSGTTLETMSQFFFFKDLVKKQNLNWKKHFIFITGKKGILKDIANENNIKTFPVPEKLGGRYSVMSAVGLLPLALDDININNLIKGAKKAREETLSSDIENNIPLKLATAEFLLKKSISVAFIYNKKLESLGMFWRQLLAESIGKNKKTGILPHVAIGTRDQHSDLQLFSEGPTNKLFTFIKEKKDPQLNLPKIKNKNFQYISQKSFSELIKASYKGVSKSLKEQNLPVQFIEIEEINEETIGKMLFYFEAEIAFLGQMFEVDPFNQPGVERGKIITKGLLEF